MSEERPSGNIRRPPPRGPPRGIVQGKSKECNNTDIRFETHTAHHFSTARKRPLPDGKPPDASKRPKPSRPLPRGAPPSGRRPLPRGQPPSSRVKRPLPRGPIPSGKKRPLPRGPSHHHVMHPQRVRKRVLMLSLRRSKKL